MRYLLLIALVLSSCKFFKKNILYSGKLKSEHTEGFGKVDIEIFDREIYWSAEVANLSGEISMSHFHCYPSGQVAATMRPNAPWGNKSFAMYAGTVNKPDEGNGCGLKTIEDLIAAFEAKKIYVNIHTPKFPAGEVKADLEVMPKINPIMQRYEER